MKMIILILKDQLTIFLNFEELPEPEETRASLKTTLPDASVATPVGLLSSALMAGPPSPEEPGRPVPASVVMMPPRLTRRTRWLS